MKAPLSSLPPLPSTHLGDGGVGGGVEAGGAPVAKGRRDGHERHGEDDREPDDEGSTDGADEVRAGGVADEDVALDGDADRQPRRHARRLTPRNQPQTAVSLGRRSIHVRSTVKR